MISREDSIMQLKVIDVQIFHKLNDPTLLSL